MSYSLSFDRVADQYDASRGYPPDIADRISAAMVRAARLTQGSEALEIGVGTGRIALPLLERSINVTGVDIAQRMLDQLDRKYARLRVERRGTGYGRLIVRVADMTSLPFQSESFDAVIAVHVFHLVEAWRQALDEVLRTLRPAGTLLVGQDFHSGSDAAHAGELQDRWREIVRQLGYEPRNVGASGYTAVVDELRARGLHIEERTVAAWETTNTPRHWLETITARLWSGTWLVPDDIFAQSVRLLTDWAERTYGEVLDTPVAAPHTFRLASVTRGSTTDDGA